MPIAIRDAVARDEQQIVDLWGACNLTVSYNDPRSDFHFALNGSASTVLIAENDDRQIAGIVMVGHDGHRAGSIISLLPLVHAVQASVVPWLQQARIGCNSGECGKFNLSFVRPTRPRSHFTITSVTRICLAF